MHGTGSRLRRYRIISLSPHESFDLAVHAARLPVWKYDVKSNRLTGNEYWHQMLGHSLSAAEARSRTETWLAGVHPDDVAQFEAVFSPGRADESGFFEAEYRMRAADGEYKWLLDRGRVVEWDVDGSPLSVIGISIDIDERKRTEQALRDSESRLWAVIQAAPVPFALNDEHENVTFVNRSFTETFGYTLADIPTLGVWWLRAYPDPAYRHWVNSTWTRRLDDALHNRATFKAMEVIICCKDGTDRTVFAFAAPLAGRSTPTHLVVLLDVTEHRVLEQKILAAVNSEQHRIGMDLHDGLGQQLTGLSLMLAAVTRHPGIQQDPALANELAVLSSLAADCVASARAIAHGLLPFESGAGAFARALHRLVDATRKVTPLQLSLGLRGVADLDLPASIASPLYRIVQEALTNAIKHAGASLVRIKVQCRDGTLKLSVTDNGRRAFDPQAAAGLGISIMRYRARALGGRVEVGRRKNGGTFVRCTCRVQAPIVAAAPVPSVVSN